DVLFGRVNPSGRLPFSWPKQLADSPSQKLGTQDRDRVDYKEGLLVGYRYYDSKQVEPEFPFGFGLSYTTFEFENLKVTRQADGVHAVVTVKNTGDRDGLCTAQFYVRPLAASVFRPEHELKAFRKVPIKASASEQVEVVLGDDAFSFYDITTGAWKVDAGRYEIQAGASSRDLPAVAPIEIARPETRSK
ncbi:MAG: glycosyl hydrolase, partial [Phycisphaerales bacterium]|nr:glycosyl hydrolase [Phycisphaerales bacterium]